jgi:hypothetical protein
MEHGLLAVFIYLSEEPAVDAIESYWKIGSCRGRYEWIDKRIKALPLGDEFAFSWASIRDELNDAIEIRNQLAHGEFTPIAISPDKEIVGYWARLAKTASTGRLSFNGDTQMIEGSPFFSPHQLIEKGLDFISLSERLYAMVDRVRNV